MKKRATIRPGDTVLQGNLKGQPDFHTAHQKIDESSIRVLAVVQSRLRRFPANLEIFRRVSSSAEGAENVRYKDINAKCLFHLRGDALVALDTYGRCDFSRIMPPTITEEKKYTLVLSLSDCGIDVVGMPDFFPEASLLHLLTRVHAAEELNVGDRVVIHAAKFENSRYATISSIEGENTHSPRITFKLPPYHETGNGGAQDSQRREQDAAIAEATAYRAPGGGAGKEL